MSKEEKLDSLAKDNKALLGLEKNEILTLNPNQEALSVDMIELNYLVKEVQQQVNIYIIYIIKG
jgi:hypothetical protein